MGPGSRPQRDAVSSGLVGGRLHGRGGADRAAGAVLRVLAPAVAGGVSTGSTCLRGRAGISRGGTRTEPPRPPRRDRVAADAGGARGCTSRAHSDPPRKGPELGARSARNAAMTFQGLILKLSEFWASRGCILQQPLDVEVGAGTMHPETFLRVIGPGHWNVAY